MQTVSLVPRATPARVKSRIKPPLLPGNDKTGKSIWQWSLPAGITCGDGMTPDCWKACYAQSGHFAGPRVKNRFAENDAMRMQDDWTDRVIGQIITNRIETVRVHVSGDFDRPDYVQQWIKIATSRKRTQFYAYTRSWASARLLPALTELAALPNFQLWLSADRSGKVPPVVPHTRIAYMSVNDDEPDYAVDMVFRVHTATEANKIGGITVCPTERKSYRGKVKCETCRLCFDRVERLDVLNRSALPILTN